MFKIGDLAVYPAHGVGRIESIEAKQIGGSEQEFYIMRILETDSGEERRCGWFTANHRQ